MARMVRGCFGVVWCFGSVSQGSWVLGLGIGEMMWFVLFWVLCSLTHCLGVTNVFSECWKGGLEEVSISAGG